MSANGYGSPWSEKAVANLTRLWADGFTCSQIGEQLGFTRNAVVGKVHRLDLPLPEGKKQINRATGIQYKKRAVAETILRCVEIVPRGLTLMDLEPNDCRFPYGGYVGEGLPELPLTFCGHPKQAGSSYCTPHFHLCDEPSKPLRSKARIYQGAAA